MKLPGATHDESDARDRRLEEALDLLTAALVLAESVVANEPDRELAADLARRIRVLGSAPLSLRR